MEFFTPDTGLRPDDIIAYSDHGHVADLVDRLNGLPREEAAALLASLSFERVVEAFDQPELDGAAVLLMSLPAAQAATLVAAMSMDRAAAILRELDEAGRTDLLRGLDPAVRTGLLDLLRYPHGSAGALMTTEFVSVPPTWTVKQTLDHIGHVERSRETVYAIYVTDPATGKLLRAVGLRRLIGADPAASILAVAPNREPVSVGPQADRARLAQLISRYDLLAVPVLDHGRMLGIVTVDDVIDAILEDTTEDVQKFGGMEALDQPYMKIGMLDMLRKRAGWLCVLFLSEMLTASAMQGYEDELQKAIVLTLFIPLIMSSGGNSGSQATSLIIRALALREISLGDWWRVALREIPTGVALGAILGLVGMGRIALWQHFGLYDYGEHWHLIALTVGCALVGIVTFGTVAGSMLPFALKALRFDPASASAPFVATLVDVSGLVIYFTVALFILRGTLL
jgi:magnesium transporter